MALFGQLLDQIGSDDDDGGSFKGSDDDTGSSLSDSDTQESDLSQFTAPSDAAKAPPSTQEDEKAASDAAAEAERIAGASGHGSGSGSGSGSESESESESEPELKRRRKKPRPGAPDAGAKPANSGRPLSELTRNATTKRLQNMLARHEDDADDGVFPAATAGFVFPIPDGMNPASAAAAKPVEWSPTHCLVVDGKVFTVFKKDGGGKFDVRACKADDDAFNDKARATFSKKKRKRERQDPPPARPAKPSPGTETKIDAHFKASPAPAAPTAPAARAPSPVPSDAAANAQLHLKPIAHPEETLMAPVEETRPPTAPKAGDEAAPAPAPEAGDKAAATSGTTRFPVSLYYTGGARTLMPERDSDGNEVAFYVRQDTRKILFDAGTAKSVVYYTLERLAAEYPAETVVLFVVGPTVTDTPLSWSTALDLVMMQA